MTKSNLLAVDRPSEPVSGEAWVPGLEHVLGDPLDTNNPFGYARAIEADEQGDLSPEGEAALDRWGMNAEFVPRNLGGRWDTTTELVRRLRPLFRRDAALGVGYGVSSMVAAVNIWAAGSAEQQRELSKLLLSGGKVSVAYHELDHGNDFLRNAFSAKPDEAGGFVLHGTKHVINNASRAAAWVVFARTDEKAGGRSHSILLLDKSRLQGAIDTGQLELLERFRTAGLRACHLAGLTFKGCRVPADRLVSSPGTGVDISLRSFQVTRIAMPGMAIGMLDTALRMAVDFARERKLYGTRVIDLPHVRSLLSDAMLDLLTADCLVRASARSLHLVPRHTSVYAAAVKYLVPSLLRDGMNALSVVLGARAYLRHGTYAIFGKMMRDMPVISVSHAGGVACLLTILSQLPALARRAERGAAPMPDLFDERVPLPPLDFGALAIAAQGEDHLLGALPHARAKLAGNTAGPQDLIRVVEDLIASLNDLRRASRELHPTETGVAAQPESFALARHYALQAAAAACTGVWLSEREPLGQAFVGQPVWIVAALSRLRARLRNTRPMLAQPTHDAIVSELIARSDEGRSFCLYDETLYGGVNVPAFN